MKQLIFELLNALTLLALTIALPLLIYFGYAGNIYFTLLIKIYVGSICFAISHLAFLALYKKHSKNSLLLPRVLVNSCIFLSVIFSIIFTFDIDKNTISIITLALTAVLSLVFKRLIAGLIDCALLKFEKNIKVDDFVSIGSTKGYVSKIGLINITIRDKFKNLTDIESSSFKDFVNSSLENVSVSATIGVDCHFSIFEIEKLANQIDIASFDTFIENPKFLGIKEFKNGKMNLLFSGKAKVSDKYNCTLELNKYLVNLFGEKLKTQFLNID